MKNERVNSLWQMAYGKWQTSTSHQPSAISYVLLAISIFALFFQSCMNDDSLHDFERLSQNNTEEGIFIVNEGNFMYSNASLSYYNPKTKAITNDVFYKTNALPLGDVAQSITINDSIAYVVLNNSGKIYIINTKTFKYTGKITGLTSPRYIHLINESKAYVSDLYAKAISIIDLQTNTIIGHISTGNIESTEQMQQLGKYVYVACWSYSNKILKIDTEMDAIVDSLTVTKQPNSLRIDKNNMLWGLSDGGFSGSSYGQDTSALTKIDLQSFTVSKVFKFKEFDASPSKLQMNSTKDSLFFIYNDWGGASVSNSGIYAMSISDSELPENPVIAQANRLIYALGISQNSDIYISDAKNYSQAGTVYCYNSNFTAVDTFDVGIAPNCFGFD